MLPACRSRDAAGHGRGRRDDMRRWSLLLGVALVVAGAVVLLVVRGNEHTTTIQQVFKDDLIRVDLPLPGARIASPVQISGRARGPWYFEASFPIELHDSDGQVIAIGPAQAQGEWMTAEYVPFILALAFPAQPSGSSGALVLTKSNASGLPEHDNELVIPIVFE